MPSLRNFPKEDQTMPRPTPQLIEMEAVCNYIISKKADQKHYYDKAHNT